MKRLAITLIAFLLSACSLWNDYEHPVMDTPSSWSGAKAANAWSAWPQAEWWMQFHSMQLSALMAQAKDASPDLAAAVARVREADAQLKIAGSALLPSVGADAGASRGKTTGGKTKNSLSASLSASYELDFWGKNWSAQESARALAEASRFDQEVVSLTITSSVANTYFAIIAVQDRLKVAGDNLKNARGLLDSLRTRFRFGTATALDVAQQESVVASAAAVIPPLELQLRQNKDALAILVGKLPEDITSPDTTLAALGAPAPVPGMPSELLTRRPDVQEAEANLISAHANIINARAQFFPSISLTGQYGYASNALSGLFGPSSMLYSVGASAAQPIFEGGLLEGQLEFAHAKYDELLADYRKAILQAFSDTEDALSAVDQNAAAEAAQQAAVNTAQQAFNLAQQQMQGGLVDISTVLNTQRTLFSAEDALVQARLAHLQSIVSLYRALGGGWHGQAH